MLVAKAYAALTDEESRKNWEMYGNPDGPGATSFGIALPSWIVEKENSIIVLGLYALVFMIALPTVVGIWWYRSIKYGGDQVLLDTTQLYYCFIHKTPHMMLKRVIMILGASFEFDRNHNSEVMERATDNFEMPQLVKELPNLGEKNKERPLCYGYSIKARALLHAHLSRMPLPPNSLEIDKLYVIKKCPYLIQEFVQCVAQLTMLALAGRIARIPSLDTLECAMKLSPLVVQGLWDSKSPLLQLPHITEDSLRHFTSRRRNIRSILQLAQMRDDERRAMLRNLSDDQYEDIINVLGNMPIIEADLTSEVLDDEESGIITAGAIVTVTVTLRRKSLRTLFNVPSDEKENENEDDMEESSELLANGDDPKKPKIWEKNKNKKSKGKGGKNKKKGQQQFVPKKPLPTEKAAIDAKPIVDEVKVKNESDSEQSDVSDDEASDNSAKSDVSDDNSSKKAEVSDQDEEAEWDRFQNRVSKKDKALETKSKLSHSVHCPYFAEDKQEHWWIYLADRKRHALTTVPVLMTNLVDREEVELKFVSVADQSIFCGSFIMIVSSSLDCASKGRRL